MKTHIRFLIITLCALSSNFLISQTQIRGIDYTAEDSSGIYFVTLMTAKNETNIFKVIKN